MPATIETTDSEVLVRLPAGGAWIVTDEIGTELFRVSAAGDVVKVEGTTLDPTLQAILNGVTATAAELNLTDGSVAGTTVASKALSVGANKETDVLALPVSGLKIGAAAGTAVDATAANLNTLASVTAGTAAASKAVVLGAGKTITGIYEPFITQADNFAPAVTDSGTTYMITVADKTVTLPATAAGVRYRFIITTAGLSAASTGFSVSPNAADKIMGAVLGIQITSADNKDIINTGATDTEGSYIEIIGDGVDGWFIVDGAGVWAREG